MVRQLASLLKKGKRADAAKQVAVWLSSQFDKAKVQRLEEVLIDTLADNELKQFGKDLRNIIRFALAVDAGITTVETDAGKAERMKLGVKAKDLSPKSQKPTPLAPTASIKGSVLLKKDVKLKTGVARDSGEAYVLSFEGPTVGVQWMQFIWRKMTATSGSGSKAPQTPIQLRQNHGTRRYLLTTNEKAPRWSVDGSSATNPFWDTSTTIERTASELTMADEPSQLVEDARRVINSVLPPFVARVEKVESEFHAAAYLLKDMEVLFRADASLKWTVTEKTVTPAIMTLKGQVASRLEAGHRAALALQFPQFDYLPGDLIGAPVPTDPFETVSLLDLVGNPWPKNSPSLERYRAAASIVKVNLIEDVSDGPPLEITNDKPRPGLNFTAPLQFPGVTDYIDSAGAPNGMAFPAKRILGLPGVRITLGEKAFSTDAAAPNQPQERNLDFTLAILRHEMTHAAHERTAIGWLVAWRDELTKSNFAKWSALQNKSNRISDADLELLRSVIDAPGAGPEGASQAHARTEGFLIAVPFLKPQPNKEKLSSLGLPFGLWPAIISEYIGLADVFGKMASKVQIAVKDRIKSGICDGLTTDQKSTLVEWLEALRAPAKLNPSTDKEKITVDTLEKIANIDRQLLTFILETTKKCPRA
jgi:hypothetical protein